MLVKLYDKKGKEFIFETVLKKIIIKVPEMVKETKHTVEFEVEKKPTVEFIRSAKSTTEFIKREEETTKYIPRTVETIKYIPKEVKTDVPSIGSIELMKEFIVSVKDVINLIPSLIKNFKAIVECARSIPYVISEFQKMKVMIESHKEPKFKDVEIINPILINKDVINAVITDVEVINAIIRDKPMTVEELRTKQRGEKHD